MTENDTDLINVSPDAGVGMQVGIDIEKVHVWTSGAEAQIEGIWCESIVTFFDLTFLTNRTWYEAGRRRDFILAGIAYKAGLPVVEKLALDPGSPLAKWQRTQAGFKDGSKPEVRLEGTSIFVPVVDWDRDDYWSRIPQMDCQFDDLLGRFCYKNQCNTIIATGQTRLTLRVTQESSLCGSISTAA